VNSAEREAPVFYPLLGGVKDLGFVRLSGHGLGNGFYSYFHAFVLARRLNGRLIHPAWLSLKTGPLRRGDASKRFYWRLFSPTPDEISGPRKYLLLTTARHNLIEIGDDTPPRVDTARINIVSCKSFTFRGLHEHRTAIRQRFLAMIREPTPAGFQWGSSDYAAIHVRLGDFAPSADISAINSGVANKRLPMSWYIAIIRRLRQQHPDRPIFLVSDGKEGELRELIANGARLVRTGSDIGDLLTLSSASLLVGSNSTFSRWAAFLGDMPSIWTSIPKPDDTPTIDNSKISFIPVGAENFLKSFAFCTG
jgi:hypothetical protein